MKETVIFLLIILRSALSYAEVQYRTLNPVSQDSNDKNWWDKKPGDKQLSTDVNVDAHYKIMDFKQGLIDSINMDVKVDDRTEDATVGAKIKF